MTPDVQSRIFLPDIALLRIDEPFIGENIAPLRIDDLWNYFPPEDIGDDLVNKSVTIYGWGLNENNVQPNQLMKQNVAVGALIHRLVLMYHREGQGSCSGDSGGIFIEE